MDFKSIIEEVKFQVTAGILDCELEDAEFGKIINSAFREIQRYIDDTLLMTIPYTECMDLSEYNISAVARVFRAKGYLMNSDKANESAPADPMYLAQWQMFTGGGSQMGLMNNFAMNYGAWNTALQVRNTISTDLLFRYERATKKLYINCPFDKPEKITVEYIPMYKDVSEITSPYWLDNLIQLSVALSKVMLGRLRTRYTQDGALWQQDGATILQEGTTELNALREKLDAASNLVYPID